MSEINIKRLVDEIESLIHSKNLPPEKLKNMGQGIAEIRQFLKTGERDKALQCVLFLGGTAYGLDLISHERFVEIALSK